MKKIELRDFHRFKLDSITVPFKLDIAFSTSLKHFEFERNYFLGNSKTL